MAVYNVCGNGRILEPSLRVSMVVDKHLCWPTSQVSERLAVQDVWPLATDFLALNKPQQQAPWLAPYTMAILMVVAIVMLKKAFKSDSRIKVLVLALLVASVFLQGCEVSYDNLEEAIDKVCAHAQERCKDYCTGCVTSFWNSNTSWTHSDYDYCALPVKPGKPCEPGSS